MGSLCASALATGIVSTDQGAGPRAAADAAQPASRPLKTYPGTQPHLSTTTPHLPRPNSSQTPRRPRQTPAAARHRPCPRPLVKTQPRAARAAPVRAPSTLPHCLSVSRSAPMARQPLHLGAPPQPARSTHSQGSSCGRPYGSRWDGEGGRGPAADQSEETRKSVAGNGVVMHVCTRTRWRAANLIVREGERADTQARANTPACGPLAPISVLGA